MERPQSQIRAQEPIVGTMGNRKRLGSHIFWEHMKDNIKEKKVHWKMRLFPCLFKDSFEITPVCDIVNQSMISVCFHLNKEVH